jgi:hypothetical protein
MINLINPPFDLYKEDAKKKIETLRSGSDYEKTKSE